MAGSGFFNNRFDSIQALRGLCALFIVAEHIRFLNCGAFGVDIFFVISGFMIMFSTERSTEHFFRKRLIRILPLYYLMTVLTFLLLLVFPAMFEQTKADPVYLVKSLLFIPFDIGGGILQPLMRIGWTVNCEIFFYLLFFIAFHISHKWRAAIASGMIVLLVAVAALMQGIWAPLSFYGAPVMLDFILGMAGFYAARRIYEYYENRPHPYLLSYLSLIAGLVIFGVLAYTKQTVNVLGFYRPLLWGVPALIILLCFFVGGLSLRSPAAIVKAGNISFSLYLLHYYPVMFLDRRIFDFSVLNARSLIGTVIAYAVCLFVAYVSYLLIEQRLGNFLKNKCNMHVDKSKSM